MFANILLGPALIYQATVCPDFPHAILANTVPNGFLTQSPDVVVRPYPVTAQQYSAFAPYIAPPAANGIGDPGSFSSVLSRPPVIYQAGVTPLTPPAPSASVPLGWISASPAVAQFGISLGDSGDLAGFVNYQPQGWWPDYPAAFAKPFPAAAQQLNTFAVPLTTVVVQARFGWWPSYPVLFAKTFPPEQQQFSVFVGALSTVVVSGIGNGGPFSNVLWRPPVIYQAGVSPLKPLVAASTPSVLGWGTSSPAVAQFPISLGDGGDLAGFVNFQPQGWWSESPALFAKPFSPALTQIDSVQAPLTTVIVLVPQGWSGIQSPRFAVPFPAAAQQYYSSTPFIAPAAANGIGDPGSFNGVLWRAPIIYQAGVSPLTALTTPPPPPTGWWVDLPPSFAKPFPAAAQQYETTARGQIASPVTPKGWLGYQLDYRFSVPYPATAQPFSVVAQLFLPPAANGIGNPGQFSSVISLPPIIYQASVLPLVPPAAVVPPVIQPPAGHGDWPRLKKANVRPVWDRRPDADRAPEPAPRSAPAVRAPVEAKPPGAPSDPSGLRRLLAPELPKPAVAPPSTVAKRPSAAVTATLSDADDEAVAVRGLSAVALGVDADDGVAALAHVVVAAIADGTDQADESITGHVSARLVANEEDDSVSTQSASDDDIALSLLFGDNDDELSLALLLGDGETT